MNFIKKILKLSGTAFTYDQYYESMNMALKRINNQHTMLHYPLYVKEDDSFIQAQKNLTDYCISLIDPLKNKNVLEIGCGNGIQALYINDKFQPSHITGIDLIKANILIADKEKETVNAENASFIVDDAQNMTRIPGDSFDVVLNIESAFHYPDKAAFLKEIHRVLKPGGQFIIADIISTRKKREGMMKIWGKPMVLHFWNRKRYDEEFLKSELKVTYFEDISKQVIKGWSLYRNWLPVIKKKRLFQNLAYRIFYMINIKMNMYFLSNRQQYVIYTGEKPLKIHE
jgi:ubiquinone/menaquinone biosynthesis C-methylase UbiE